MPPMTPLRTVRRPAAGPSVLAALTPDDLVAVAAHPQLAQPLALTGGRWGGGRQYGDPSW